MTAQNTRSVTIIDGPSKDGLKAALFDRSPINKRVKFSIKKGFSHEVVVQGVRIGEGLESWHIQGYAYVMMKGAKIPFPLPPRRVEIHFRTDYRKGIMTFIS